jgi:hypothetical protein
MAELLNLKTHSDSRGALTVVENLFDFDIKRIYYIYNVDNEVRGGHRHKITKQAAICIKGSCEIYVNNGEGESNFILDSPDKCLILDTIDWHTMSQFSSDAVLLVIASENFDANDYIYEKY